METLLTHRDWVRRLARSLVRDQASADDVEQRTWLVALRNPPRYEATARSWLARVVRSQVLDAFRARGRREAHERAAACPAAPRSPADVVEEAESHRRLVVAVQNLAEPYRTTVLLRWFEHLPPRAVAERTGVPLETARTRLRRAHDALREELGRDAGGRSGWIAALAPLTGLRPESAVATATATATAAETASSTIAAAKAAGTLGGAAVGTKTAVAVAVGVAVAAAFVGGTIVGEHGDRAAVTTPDPAIAELRSRLDALDTARSRPSERPSASDIDRRVDALERTVASLRETAASDAQKLAMLVEKSEAPGASATSPIRTVAGQSPAQAVADLLRLDPARQAEFERAYEDVLRRLRETEARHATATTSSDGTTTTIRVSRFPEDGAALLAEWQDWITRSLTADERAKYDKYELGRNLFPRGWPRSIGEYDRMIVVQKTPGSVSIMETGVSPGGNNFSNSTTYDPKRSPLPYQHLMK